VHSVGLLYSIKQCTVRTLGMFVVVSEISDYSRAPVLADSVSAVYRGLKNWEN
jgi:hypothetical protein